MYIRTENGWRPLWSVAQPTLSEVRERVVWLTGTTPSNAKERSHFESTQHIALLELRMRTDKERDKMLKKKTGIKMKSLA